MLVIWGAPSKLVLVMMGCDGLWWRVMVIGGAPSELVLVMMGLVEVWMVVVEGLRVILVKFLSPVLFYNRIFSSRLLTSL